MAEIRPPEMPPMYRPQRSARPWVVSMPKVSGRKRTTAMVADSPGMEPKMIPMTVPNQMRNRHIGVNVLANASAIIADDTIAQFLLS